MDPENRRTRAVALTIPEPDAAPVVAAKGYGMTAEAIIQKAQEAGLYVHAAPDLVDLLMHIDLDQQVPPHLYVVLAELLTWLHQMDNALTQTP